MNKKISQLTNSLTKSTVAIADILPIVDTSTSETKKITYQELIQPQDDQFAISGSADNTKKVRFEVDGVTTGTTRAITIPDANTTMVGTDTTQTLTNKTLTSPTITGATLTTSTVNGVTPSTSAGATNYLAGDGTYKTVTVANATYATTGAVQGLTDAATSGLTITAGVISVNDGTTANKIVKLNGSAQIPAVDGSLLTGITPKKYSNITSATVLTGVTTTVVTNAISANTLAVGSILRGKVYGQIVHINGNTPATITVAYGVTTIGGGTVTLGGASSTYPLVVSFEAEIITSTTANISYSYVVPALSLNVHSVSVNAAIANITSSQNFTVVLAGVNDTSVTFYGTYYEII